MTVPYLMDMLKLLVENGADINKKDTARGRTALHHAVEIPAELTVEPIHYLIQKGANINSLILMEIHHYLLPKRQTTRRL